MFSVISFSLTCHKQQRDSPMAIGHGQPITWAWLTVPQRTQRMAQQGASTQGSSLLKCCGGGLYTPCFASGTTPWAQWCQTHPDARCSWGQEKWWEPALPCVLAATGAGQGAGGLFRFWPLQQSCTCVVEVHLLQLQWLIPAALKSLKTSQKKVGSGNRWINHTVIVHNNYSEMTGPPTFLVSELALWAPVQA